MSRVMSPLASRIPLFAALAAALAVWTLAMVLAAPSLAGERRHGGVSLHGGQAHVGGHRVRTKHHGGRKEYRLHARYAYRNPIHHGSARHPAASSGVMLSSGHGTRYVHHPRWKDKNRRLDGYFYWNDGGRFAHDGHSGKRRHHGYRHAGTAIIIAVNPSAPDAAAPLDGEQLIEQACAPGEYCTLRLGPYANSPKIITLNTSGRTIDQQALEGAAPVGTPAPDETGDGAK